MTPAPPARPGDHLGDVDTPALIVDLDAFDANLRLMAERTKGVRLRPHAKSHKCAEIAKRQMALGAIGVCCQKASEARALADAGVTDILLSNEVVDRRKLAALLDGTDARISLCVDSLEGLAAIPGPGTQHPTPVFVEVNVGGDRCGVEPGEPALALARAVHDHPGLRFAGIHAYQGRAQHVRSWDERKATAVSAASKAAETRDLLEQNGIAVPVITGGGTGTYEFDLASGVYGEVQPGSYIFMDADYGRNLDSSGGPRSPFRQSLFVLAQVMSARPTHAIVDAGLKALAFDSGVPLVHGHPGVIYERPSDEHGMLRLEGRRFAIGEKIRLIPGHCDPTVNLYDWIVAYRAERVEEVWTVTARGAIR